MVGAQAVLWAVAFLAAQLTIASPSPVTAPAFMWSPYHLGSSRHGIKEVVDYRTISPDGLVKSVMSEGGWSNLVCSGENFDQNVDIALVFVGRKLQSSDVSRAKYVDPALLELLKTSFTSSNVSMAFPYVAASDEKDTLENSLISGFIDNCGQAVGAKHIAYLDSCSVNSVNHEGTKKLQGLHSLLDFVSSRTETARSGHTYMIVFCSPSTEESDNVQSEGEILLELVNSLEQTGAKYTVLYASDPYRSVRYNSHLPVSRFLAESSGNTSANSTDCDGVCQFQSSLLEGIFVAIVLLIILISGLCCMMGIDTPTRFEAPLES